MQQINLEEDHVTCSLHIEIQNYVLEREIIVGKVWVCIIVDNSCFCLFQHFSADRTKSIPLVQYILVQLMTKQFENYTLYNMVEKGL